MQAHLWVPCSKSATVSRGLEALWDSFITKPTHTAAVLPGPSPWGGLGFHIWILEPLSSVQWHRQAWLRVEQEQSNDAGEGPSTGEVAANASFRGPGPGSVGPPSRRSQWGARDLGNFPSHPALGIWLWPPPAVLESSGCTEICCSRCSKTICHVSGQQDS